MPIKNWQLMDGFQKSDALQWHKKKMGILTNPDLDTSAGFCNIALINSSGNLVKMQYMLSNVVCSIAINIRIDTVKTFLH